MVIAGDLPRRSLVPIRTIFVLGLAPASARIERTHIHITHTDIIHTQHIQTDNDNHTSRSSKGNVNNISSNDTTRNSNDHANNDNNNETSTAPLPCKRSNEAGSALPPLPPPLTCRF